jgi:ABC-type glutathione transport system ATPase component
VTNNNSTAVLRVEDLSKTFTGGRAFGSANRKRTITAVDHVSLELFPCETLALVGESGSGKSTISRMIMGLTTPTSGSIYFNDIDIANASARDLRRSRRQLQMVFQDPYGSLHPRRRIASAVAEPWKIQGMYSRAERRERAIALLQSVELDGSYADRLPGELSGGQRQRVAIARALALEPSVLVLDEPVSALDVSMQAQILNLLVDLQKAKGLTYLLISHDLALVRMLADRVAVMKSGQLVEVGSAVSVYSAPKHPYTRALLEAADLTAMDFDA